MLAIIVLLKKLVQITFKSVCGQFLHQSVIRRLALTVFPLDGALLQPGKVADVQHLFLRAYITADQLSQLTLGDKVKVFSDLPARGSQNI